MPKSLNLLPHNTVRSKHFPHVLKRQNFLEVNQWPAFIEINFNHMGGFFMSLELNLPKRLKMLEPGIS
jgi:hypothetical protein